MVLIRVLAANEPNTRIKTMTWHSVMRPRQAFQVSSKCLPNPREQS
jgi:hypothetical protein